MNIMNLTKFSINRPIGICMVVAFFVVLGLFSFYRIGVELLPALNTPYVTVSVKYPGANADSVEQQVVKPVENALSSVSNLTPSAASFLMKLTNLSSSNGMSMPRQSCTLPFNQTNH